MIGFSITPLMRNGEVTTYRIHGVRPDGTHYYDFGATLEYAFQFGLKALAGEETRDPSAIARKLQPLPVVFG